MHKVINKNTPTLPRSNSVSSVSIIVIESNSLLRDGLTRILDSTRFQILASCSSFEAIPSSLERSPNLILIGANHATFDIGVLKNCSERFPSARRVVLGDFRENYGMMIIEAGAHACLGINISTEALLTSLNLVASGVCLVCQADSLLAGRDSERKCQNGHAVEITMSGQCGSDEIAYRLSMREIAVLECLVHGDANKAIARKFDIAEATVKVHIKAILRKIRAANRTQAAIWAVSHLPSNITNAWVLSVVAATFWIEWAFGA